MNNTKLFSSSHFHIFRKKAIFFIKSLGTTWNGQCKTRQSFSHSSRSTLCIYDYPRQVHGWCLVQSTNVKTPPQETDQQQRKLCHINILCH